MMWEMKSQVVGGLTNQDNDFMILISIRSMSWLVKRSRLSFATVQILTFFFSFILIAMHRVVREVSRAWLVSHMFPVVARYRSKRSMLIATVCLESWKWSITL